MNIAVIGAGGIGSYLIPCLVKTTKEVTILDGDTFEEKNMSRQIFKESDMDRNKAEALAEMYGVKAEGRYFKRDSDVESSIILCCVDNDATRMDLLEHADEENIIVIIGGNETYSSSAMVYRPEWKDTKLDPRVIHPDYAERNGRDPRQPPCNSDEAIEENPQLPLANMMAASLMLKLLEYYMGTYPELEPEHKQYAPHSLYAAKAGIMNISIGERNANN